MKSILYVRILFSQTYGTYLEDYLCLSFPEAIEKALLPPLNFSFQSGFLEATKKYIVERQEK